jgi:hypothetical protein
MKSRHLLNSKGQVAIFVALMFQVLFLFFAMIVNVGLLVHHKINLQNSVDIAAYYGAMKQAEVLNAIAHVNYQIRQSWKLLAWRQKVLGTAGVDPEGAQFPYRRLTLGGAGGVSEQLAGGSGAASSPWTQPLFCISYSPHEVQGASTANTENSCKLMWDQGSMEIFLPRAGVLQIPSFMTFGLQVAAAITAAANQAFDRCAIVGHLNYLVGGTFMAAHYRDSEERAFLINSLATSLSQQADDFYDLTGEKVSDGLRKTLEKNLTSANNATVSMELFNSMAEGPCRNPVTSAGSRTPGWLVPINVYPIWRYLDCRGNGNAAAGQILMASKQIMNSPITLPAMLGNPAVPPAVAQAVQSLNDVLVQRTTLVGFEKNPWCVPYVGVRATAKPKIPFMPLSDVEISAKAFAKPFGGRIGPWYVKTWPAGMDGNARLGFLANSADANARAQKIEPIGPTRVTDLGGLTNPDDPAWSGNVARFVGDNLGFSSERLLAFFHRLIIGPAAGLPQIYQNLPSTIPLPYNVLPDTRVSLRYYENVAAPYSPNGPNDPLTWDQASGQAPKLRLMELAAIAPTLFDMAYYSIEPDFYNNYYTQIDQGIKSGNLSWQPNRALLGDLGWRGNNEAAKKFNIMNQIAVQNALAVPDALNADIAFPSVARNPAHLLNSWVADDLLNYKTSASKFGQCLSPNSQSGAFATPLDPPTPGNCVLGGRVGYSVKLVAREWLTEKNLNLGGEGTSGAILNPPPASW